MVDKKILKPYPTTVNTSVMINGKRADVTSLAITYDVKNILPTCGVTVVELSVYGEAKERKAGCFLRHIEVDGDNTVIYLDVMARDEQPFYTLNADMDFFEKEFYSDSINNSPKTFWRFNHNGA